MLVNDSELAKKRALADLVALRRRDIPEGFRSVSEFHNGAYEAKYVSPYSKSAHNLNAEVMLIAQDWVSEEYLLAPLNRNLIDLGHEPNLPTNRNLFALLESHLGLSFSQTYATNLFPFVKPEAMTAGIPARELVTAARIYALPQIRIIQPRIVVCLGAGVFRALERALGRRPSRSLSTAIENPLELDGASIWAQAHPGGLGRAGRNRGGIDRVDRSDFDAARQGR